MNRRKFVQMGATGAFGFAIATHLASARRPVPRRLKKAVKFDMIDVEGSVRDKFALLKELGFDGVEMSSPNDLDRDEVREARSATGLPIHGVVDSAHWQMTLSDPDATVRANGVAALRTALRAAQAYGASTVLLVPAVVN
ncbi:MAG: TIM barrel protein, partial [Rhodothermales bacterium]